MNYVSYLSTYAMVYESISELGYYDEESALEGFGSKIRDAQNRYNDELSAASAKLNEALNRKDQAAAMAAVGSIEKVINDAINEANSMPKDKFNSIRQIAKIALAVIGIIIMIKSGKSFDIAKNLIAKTPASGVIKSALAKAPAVATGKTATKVAKFVTANAVGSFGFKTFMKGAKASLDAVKVGSKQEFEALYGSNPNASSVLFRKYYSVLQQEKASIPQLKQAVKEYCAS